MFNWLHASYLSAGPLGAVCERGINLMDRTLTTGDSNMESQSSDKVRWHAPTLKRLDVDLTAGNKRNSNDAPTSQNLFLNS